MKLSWRDCHDYHGNKVKQKCLKCGRILLAKDGWVDKEPKCAKRDERTMEQTVIDFFGNKIPNPYFHVNVKPFTPIKITVQDLLDGK